MIWRYQTMTEQRDCVLHPNQRLLRCSLALCSVRPLARVILVLRVMCSNIYARASLARLAVLLLLLVGTLRNLSCLREGMRVSQPHT